MADVDHAVLLAAGQGTRMWPLTATRPKPLLPVGGQPIVARLIEQTSAAGLHRITLVAAEAKGPLVQEAARAAEEHGLELDVAVQSDQRGTGHALAQAELAGEPALVLYGDLFLPEGALADFADAVGSAGIGAREVPDVSEYGALETDGDRLISIDEKPQAGGAGLVNAGVYVVPADFGEELEALEESPRGELELTDAVEAAAQTDAFTVHTFQRWIDVGWPWDLLEANAAALDELPEEPPVEGQIADSADLIGRVHVAESAEIRQGSVVKGPTYIGPGARVGPNAYVRGATTLGPDTKVGHACEVKNSLLLEGAQVPHVSYVGDSVLGADVNLGAGTQVANLRHDGADVQVETPRGRIDSGRRKLGVILGDEAKTGINATLNVGVLLAPGAGVRPGATVMASRLPERG